MQRRRAFASPSRVLVFITLLERVGAQFEILNTRVDINPYMNARQPIALSPIDYWLVSRSSTRAYHNVAYFRLSIRDENNNKITVTITRIQQ